MFVIYEWDICLYSVNFKCGIAVEWTMHTDMTGHLYMYTKYSKFDAFSFVLPHPADKFSQQYKLHSTINNIKLYKIL